MEDSWEVLSTLPWEESGWLKKAHIKKSLFSSNKKYPGTFHVTMGLAFTGSSEKPADNTLHDALFIWKAEGGKGIKGLWGSNYTSLTFIITFVLTLGCRKDTWRNSWKDRVNDFFFSAKMYSKREQSAPAAELVIASATYWGQLVHDAGTASEHSPTTLWWPAPLLHLIYPTHLEAAKWKETGQGKAGALSPWCLLSLWGRKQSLLWCWPVLRLSGEVVRKTALARVCVQEKLEGPRSHSQIPLSVPKLRDTRLGASNKMGSPQCLRRQASKSFWPAGYLWIYSLFSFSIWHWKSSGQRYVLCRSITQGLQYVSRSPHYRCPISVHPTSVICLFQKS